MAFTMHGSQAIHGSTVGLEQIHRWPRTEQVQELTSIIRIQRNQLNVFHIYIHPPSLALLETITIWLDQSSISCCVVVMCVLDIPLYAARRTMAAVPPLPNKRRQAFAGMPIYYPRPA